VVIYLQRCAECLHMVQLVLLHPQTPSSLALFKPRLVLPFSYQLTQVVLEKVVIKQAFFVSLMVLFSVVC